MIGDTIKGKPDKITTSYASACRILEPKSTKVVASSLNHNNVTLHSLSNNLNPTVEEAVQTISDQSKKKTNITILSDSHAKNLTKRSES